MRESAVKNSPLPPSVEKAYHQKCIELKRRIRGVEEANDVARQRVHRLDRAIMKMRVNRAFLMDRLAKLQELNDSESEISSTRPSSPHDQTTATAPKSRNRDEAPSTETPDHSAARAVTPDGHAAAPQSRTPAVSSHPAEPSQQSPAPPVDSNYHPKAAPPHPSFTRPAPDLPLINSLPNGTSVMLIAPSTPKPAPWVITELDPRHHVHPEFENWSIDEQEDFIFKREYLPFEKTGTPVVVHYDPYIRKYRHIHPQDPMWRNPVQHTMRRDAAEYRNRMPRPPPGPEDKYEQFYRGFLSESHGRPAGTTVTYG